MITNPNEATFNDKRMSSEKKSLLITIEYFNSKKDILPVEKNSSETLR